MDDLISRQAAIDALKNRWKKTRNYEGIGDDIAEECELYLKQVPSARLERKKGEWIPVTNGRGGFECDQCHNYAPSYQDGVEWLSGFCPNCGAKMVEYEDYESESGEGENHDND